MTPEEKKVYQRELARRRTQKCRDKKAASAKSSSAATLQTLRQDARSKIQRIVVDELKRQRMASAADSLQVDSALMPSCPLEDQRLQRIEHIVNSISMLLAPIIRDAAKQIVVFVDSEPLSNDSNRCENAVCSENKDCREICTR